MTVKRVSALLALLLSISFLSPATAMGSGNKYSDLQTGVSFSVYEPTHTLGLSTLAFQVRPCRLFPTHEEFLFASFGGMDRGIALVETSAQYNCTGLDNPQSLGTIVINGIKAKVGIYCATQKCPANKFSQHGGEITFITPRTKLFKPTFIRVGTQGGFSLKQLISFAKGLKPISAK